LAARYVEVIGGIDATVEKAREYAAAGDLRFAVELASHAVFVDQRHEAAVDLLEDVLTKLGYGSECATWRNNFLTGAQELRTAPAPIPVDASGLSRALTITQLFDSLAIRLDPQRAGDSTLSVRWNFTDRDETYRMELSNGVLIHFPTRRDDPADLVATLTHPQLLALLAGAGLDGIDLQGNPGALTMILSLLDDPDPAFSIVTP
jgi:alkyl sulfatase BDS1-like metallo-beta-lactamase superfamily hydrolase